MHSQLWNRNQILLLIACIFIRPGWIGCEPAVPETNTTTPTESPTESPSDSESVETPLLPFGDINVVFVTDVHSWIGGHGRKEPQLNADYGDVLSFYIRLKEYCDNSGQDLWFVMNGDWIDGTGLATDGDPSHIIPLLQKMPWDAVNVGNHELYHAEVIEYLSRPGGFIEWWGDRYLSSNIMDAVSQESLGARYRILRGRSSVLAFGFLFDMKNNADTVVVTEVEVAVEQSWFKEALHAEAFDAVLVLAHMDAADDLLHVIRRKIRSELGDDMPVQFIAGHTHHRGYEVLDPASTSVEAGRYLDTVGFASFPTRGTVAAAIDSNMTDLPDLFNYTYLDANVDVMRDALNVDSLATEDGRALSDFIALTQQKLGLTTYVSCIPQTYKVSAGLNESDSLWAFFRDTVAPSQFDSNEVVFLGRGTLRYDLIEGDLLADDIYGVSPFDGDLVALHDLPSDVIIGLNATLNNATPSFLPSIPFYILSPANPSTSFGVNETYTLITDVSQVAAILDALPESYAQSQMNRTTTSIWMDFFEDNDLCSGKQPSRNRNHNGKDRGADGTHTSSRIDTRSQKTLQALLATLALVVLSGAVLWRRRAVAADSAATSTSFSVLNESDDMDDGSGDDEHELL